MMRFYYHPRSTYARRVWIALLEKSIPFEPVLLDMAGVREHRQPAYLALNPFGRVPTLVDGALTLYESSAILLYLEAKFPEPSLLPEGLEARAAVDRHMRLADVELGQHAGTIIFPKRFMPEERWDRAAFAKASKALGRYFAVLASELEGRDYLIGDRFTLADLTCLPFLPFLPLYEIDIPPAVAVWSQRLLARPSALATAPDK